MRYRIVGAALAAMVVASSAGAATLNFLAEANGNERGVADNTSIVMDGVNVTFSATYNGSASGAYAYFDHGGGLGVCHTGLDANQDCNTPSDDNLTALETMTIAFDFAMDLSGLKFNAEGHNPFSAAQSAVKTLLFSVDGGTLTEYTFANLMAASFSGITSATFGFGAGSDEDQYYLTSATTVPSTISNPPPIPLPATAPMLLTALGVIGFGVRRLKKRHI